MPHVPASENFNVASSKAPEKYTLEILGEHTIRGTQRHGPNNWTSHMVTVDFLNRIVIVAPCADTNGAQTFPFSQFDAGSIEWHYHQMKAAGRNPRAPDGLMDKPAPAGKSGGLAL